MPQSQSDVAIAVDRGHRNEEQSTHEGYGKAHHFVLRSGQMNEERMSAFGQNEVVQEYYGQRKHKYGVKSSQRTQRSGAKLEERRRSDEVVATSEKIQKSVALCIVKMLLSEKC